MPKSNAKRKAPEGASVDNAKKPAPHLVKEDAPPAPEVLPGLPTPPAAQLEQQPQRMARAPMEFSAKIDGMLSGKVAPQNPATPVLLARMKDILIDVNANNQALAQKQQDMQQVQQALAELSAQREHLQGALRSQGETIWHLETGAS